MRVAAAVAFLNQSASERGNAKMRFGNTVLQISDSLFSVKNRSYLCSYFSAYVVVLTGHEYFAALAFDLFLATAILKIGIVFTHSVIYSLRFSHHQ